MSGALESIDTTAAMAISARREQTPQRNLLAVAVAVVAIVLAVAAMLAQDNSWVDTRIYHRALAELSGGGLYDYGTLGYNFIYPPFAALVLWPLLLLSEDVAIPVVLVASVLAAFGSFTIMLKAAQPEMPNHVVSIVSGALLFTVPASSTFGLGQINAFLALAIAIDVVLLGRSHRFAGVLSGLATAIKLSPALGVVFLARRRCVRFVVVAGLTTVVATVLGALVLWSESWRFWTDVVFVTGDIAQSRPHHNASLNGVLTHAFGHSIGVALATYALGAALSIAAFRRTARFVDVGDYAGVMLVASCVGYVISPLSWLHHHWFAPLAVVVFVLRAASPHQRALAAVSAAGVLYTTLTGPSAAALPLAVGTATIIALALPERRDASGPQPTATHTMPTSLPASQ